MTKYTTIKEHKSPNGNLREVGFEYTRSAKKDKWTHKHLDFLLANGFIEEVKEPKLKGVESDGSYRLHAIYRFETEEDADVAEMRINAEAFLMQKAVECGSRGFVPGEDNWGFDYDHDSNALILNKAHSFQAAPDWAIFPTSEAARKFRKTPGVLENYKVWLNMK